MNTTITMLESEVMGKGYITKRIPGKGEKKLRSCLGVGCTKKFVTTPETRICQKCKRAMESSMMDESYEVHIEKKKEN